MKSFLDMTFAEFTDMLRNLKRSESVHECDNKDELAFPKDKYIIGLQFDLPDGNGKPIRFITEVSDYVNKNDISDDPQRDETSNIFLTMRVNSHNYFNFKITNFFGDGVDGDEPDFRRYILHGYDFSPTDTIGDAMKCATREIAEQQIKNVQAAEYRELKEIDELMGK